MSKEKLKSLLLVVLIATSVVLTQRVWFSSPLQMISSEASYLYEKEDQLHMVREQLIRPEKIIIGFGGGAENSHYSLLSPSDLDRFWQGMKAMLTDYFVSEPTMQVISSEEYETLRTSRHVEMHFGKGFPTAFLSVLFDQQENSLASATNEIKSILVPARHQGNLYLVGDQGQVFEFQLQPEDQLHQVDVAQLVDSIPVNSYVKYYPLFSYAGNQTLLPLTYQTNKPKVFTESEIDASSNDHMNRWAGRFFNENFDFVKTIQETGGTRIYMYGYGQQEVRINNRGLLEYTAETGRQSSSSVSRALDTALMFMAVHYGTSDVLVLREVELIEENGLRGYRFGFGYHLRDLPVVPVQLRQPLEIEVFGDGVRSFSALLRRPMSLPEVMPEAGILSPHRIIEDNFNMLLEELAQHAGLEIASISTPDELDTASENSTEEVTLTEEGNVTGHSQVLTGEDLLGAIRHVELVYLDREETHRRQLMLPVWRIIIDQLVYDFDAHEGNRLQTTVLTEGDEG